MIVVCPACQARFQYDEGRFGTAAVKRFKCPKCAHVFEVANPGLTALVPDGTLSQPLAPAPNEPTPPAPLTVPVPPPPEPEPTVEGLQARTTARRDRDTLLAAAGLLPRPKLRVSLAFLSGPQASMVQVLEQAITLIGREEGEIITRDPETSRRHAQLEIRPDGTVWLTDLNSTNGTVVNGERITGPTQLLS
ncbi:MAG TPA: FHA domain-containing protein, partial [Holophagaceae bacterium]